MENWYFLDPPRWTVDIDMVDGMEVTDFLAFLFLTPAPTDPVL